MVRSPGEEQRAAPRSALERRQRQQVVVQVRGERQARQRTQVGTLARNRDQAREVEQLVVEVLADGVRRPGCVLRGLQRHRDRRPVRVVLGVLDRLAGRQEECDGARRQHRRDGRAGQLCGHPVPRGPPQRQRHEAAERERGARHQQHEAADVGLDRVARLQPQALHVDLTARDAPDRLTLDRPRLDPQAGGQAHRIEPRSPVHQRHVDVQRARWPGSTPSRTVPVDSSWSDR